MRKEKKNESGRSMVEMLGVMAMLVIVTLGSLAGYKYLVKSARSKETAREIGELIASMQGMSLSRTIRPGQVVDAGKIVKGPKLTRALSGHKGEGIVLPDSEDSYAVVYNMGLGSFGVAFQIDGSSCEDVLKTLAAANISLTGDWEKSDGDFATNPYADEDSYLNKRASADMLKDWVARGAIIEEGADDYEGKKCTSVADGKNSHMAADGDCKVLNAVLAACLESKRSSGTGKSAAVRMGAKTTCPPGMTSDSMSGDNVCWGIGRCEGDFPYPVVGGCCSEYPSEHGTCGCPKGTTRVDTGTKELPNGTKVTTYRCGGCDVHGYVSAGDVSSKEEPHPENVQSCKNLYNKYSQHVCNENEECIECTRDGDCLVSNSGYSDSNKYKADDKFCLSGECHGCDKDYDVAQSSDDDDEVSRGKIDKTHVYCSKNKQLCNADGRCEKKTITCEGGVVYNNKCVICVDTQTGGEQDLGCPTEAVAGTTVGDMKVAKPANAAKVKSDARICWLKSDDDSVDSDFVHGASLKLGNQCVECLTDAHCAHNADRKICNPNDHRCYVCQDTLASHKSGDGNDETAGANSYDRGCNTGARHCYVGADVNGQDTCSNPTQEYGNVCAKCITSADCELSEFCVTDGNVKDENGNVIAPDLSICPSHKTNPLNWYCAPCSRNAPDAQRPSNCDENCACPDGLVKFPPNGSTQSTTYCFGNGGAWRCAEPVIDCSNGNCPQNECCLNNQCSPTDAHGNRWYRPDGLNQPCKVCKKCERYDLARDLCVPDMSPEGCCGKCYKYDGQNGCVPDPDQQGCSTPLFTCPAEYSKMYPITIAGDGTGTVTFETAFEKLKGAPADMPNGKNTLKLTKAQMSDIPEVCEIGNSKLAGNFKTCNGNKCCENVANVEDCCSSNTAKKGTVKKYLCGLSTECTCCQPLDPTANLNGHLIGACVEGCDIDGTYNTGKTKQLCITKDGGENDKGCGGCQCKNVPKCLVKVNAANGETYFTAPSNAMGVKYTMTHPSAERFCKYFGSRLSTVASGCLKGQTYDSGYDCPNLINGTVLEKPGSKPESLITWYWVNDNGTFWLYDQVGDNEALRVTASCGNNHADDMCQSYYPICDGSPTGAPFCQE